MMLQCGAFVLQETKRLEIKKFIVKMGAKQDNLHVEFYQYLNSAHALTAQSDTAIHATTASSFARGSSITGSSSMQSINKHNIDAESSLLEGKTIKRTKNKPNLTGQITMTNAAIAACLKHLSVSCAVPAGE